MGGLPSSRAPTRGHEVKACPRRPAAPCWRSFGGPARQSGAPDRWGRVQTCRGLWHHPAPQFLSCAVPADEVVEAEDTEGEVRTLGPPPAIMRAHPCEAAISSGFSWLGVKPGSHLNVTFPILWPPGGGGG